MLNPGNCIVVWYPKHGLRIRSCQTTVYPPNETKRNIIDPKKRIAGFNKWTDYIRAEVSCITGHGETQLDETKRILNSVTVK